MSETIYKDASGNVIHNIRLPANMELCCISTGRRLRWDLWWERTNQAGLKYRAHVDGFSRRLRPEEDVPSVVRGLASRIQRDLA